MKIEIRTRLLTLIAGIVLALGEISLAWAWGLSQSAELADDPTGCECLVANAVEVERS